MLVRVEPRPTSFRLSPHGLRLWMCLAGVEQAQDRRMVVTRVVLLSHRKRPAEVGANGLRAGPGRGRTGGLPSFRSSRSKIDRQ